MTNHHDVFKALAPIEWDTIDKDDLKTFLTQTFGDAQCLLDSIPLSINSKPISRAASTGRPRSATDPAGPRLPERAPKTSEHAEHLRKEWKEVQINPRENPLGVNVYKMSSKDKKGAWFARRSVHEGLSFDQWKLGMQAEFAESLKVQGEPGSGKIRGIGADRKVVNQVVEGCGKMEGTLTCFFLSLMSKSLIGCRSLSTIRPVSRTNDTKRLRYSALELRLCHRTSGTRRLSKAKVLYDRV